MPKWGNVSRNGGCPFGFLVFSLQGVPLLRGGELLIPTPLIFGNPKIPGPSNCTFAAFPLVGLVFRTTNLPFEGCPISIIVGAWGCQLRIHPEDRTKRSPLNMS